MCNRVTEICETRSSCAFFGSLSLPASRFFRTAFCACVLRPTAAAAATTVAARPPTYLGGRQATTNAAPLSKIMQQQRQKRRSTSIGSVAHPHLGELESERSRAKMRRSSSELGRCAFATMRAPPLFIANQIRHAF